MRNGSVDQQSRISKVNTSDGTSYQEVLPQEETRFALLANFFLSEGKSGKVTRPTMPERDNTFSCFQVLRVHAKKRIGQDDFVSSIRKSLASFYGDKVVGMHKQMVT